MSGGFYQYKYHWLRDLAEEIDVALREDKEYCYGSHNQNLRKHFVELLLRVSDAAHDIEWVDSGDYEPGDEDKRLRKVHGKTICEKCKNEISSQVTDRGCLEISPCFQCTNL